jgi:predicted  nucleic acid-binding Zn-ribbon protein
MDDKQIENREIRDINDSLDSLHQRMDRFYAWASQLQVEMRNAHQRLWVLETAMGGGLNLNNPKVNSKIDKAEPTEESLLDRLKNL